MIGFSNIQEKNYQSKIVFQVVLSGMPRNNVYKKECCNYTLGFKEIWNSKDKLKKSKLKDQTIIEAFKARDRTQKDSTLPITEWAYRLELVEQFLRAAIPIGKIDMLRSLFEKNGQRLTARAHLGQYISIVFKRKVERIKNY